MVSNRNKWQNYLLSIGTIAAGVLFCFAFGWIADDDDNEKVGTLALNEFQRKSFRAQQHSQQARVRDGEFPAGQEFNSLPALLLAFNSNRVEAVYLPKSTGSYLCQNNKGFRMVEDPRVNCYYQTAVTAKHRELLGRINQAFRDLKSSDGLEQLRNSQLDPAQSAIFDHTESAETCRIGVTDDLPPWDSLTPEGFPGGFNRKIIDYLSRALQLRIVAVPLKLQEQYSALKSGTVDALFQVVSFNDQYRNTDDEFLFSNPFYRENAVWIYKRSSRTKVRIRR